MLSSFELGLVEEFPLQKTFLIIILISLLTNNLKPATKLKQIF